MRDNVRAGVTEVPRRLAVLFLLAIAGVLVAVGVVLGRIGGSVAVTVYAALVLVVVVVGAQLAKRRGRAAASANGRTCTCCTGTVHDPVQVI